MARPSPAQLLAEMSSDLRDALGEERVAHLEAIEAAGRWNWRLSTLIGQILPNRVKDLAEAERLPGESRLVRGARQNTHRLLQDALQKLDKQIAKRIG